MRSVLEILIIRKLNLCFVGILHVFPQKTCRLTTLIFSFYQTVTPDKTGDAADEQTTHIMPLIF